MTTRAKGPKRPLLMPSVAPLEELGFRPIPPDETLHNPLRLYLVMPVRGPDGVWFAVPVMQAPLPEDCDALLALARKMEEERKPRRFLDPNQP